MNDIHLFRLIKEELQTTALIKMGKKTFQNEDPQENTKNVGQNARTIQKDTWRPSGEE